MAIKSYDRNNKIELASRNSSKENTFHLFNQSFATHSSTTSSIYKREKNKLKEHEPRLSTYLTNNKVLSRRIEKKIIEKKGMDYMSSLPLAANIYKANSDEFKSTKRINRKNKKSVLTLPNESMPDVQTCTVSDMNDSEYSQTNVNCRPRPKRTVINNVRQSRTKNKHFGNYDVDTRNCSKLNSSSTNIIKRCKGDSKAISNNNGTNDFKLNKEANEQSLKLHNVWSVLRNLHRFQFIPSPPMSDESNLIPKKKKTPNKRINCKDARVVETCRIEEIAYISSYKVGDSSLSLSQSSSFDRITVINKKDECSKIYTKLQNKTIRKGFLKDGNKNEFDGRKKIQKKTFKTRADRTTCHLENEEKDANSVQKHYSNVKIQNNLEDRHAKYNVFSPLFNKNDLQEMQRSPIVSVTNTKNGGMKCKLGLVEYSDNFSENSKKKNITKKQSKEQNNLAMPYSELPQAKGITRVMSKFDKQSIRSLIKPHLHETQERRSQLMTTTPSVCMLPKYTQTDTDTLAIQKTENRDGVHPRNRNNNTFSFDYNSKKLIKPNYEVVKDFKCKSKKIVNNNLDKIQNKLELKRTAICSNSVLKQKPIAQFKDKILNLLYKRVSNKCFQEKYDKNSISLAANNTKIKVDACTETQIKSTSVSKNLLKSKRFDASVISLNKGPNNKFKYPWAKAKRASDCIENVIEKIKNGVYFNEDKKYINRISEVSIQTDHISYQGNFCELDHYPPKMLIKKKKDNVMIPGFDGSLLGLEIQNLNMKEITVKHCTTNVMIKFDITVLNEINEIALKPKSSSIVMPIKISENQIKVFKCNKSILNATLPAEVCSIIPKMIEAIDPSIKSNMRSNSATVYKTVSNMSTISEMSRTEFTLAITDSNKSFKLLARNTSLFNMLQGRFQKTCKYPDKTKVTSKVNTGSILVIDFLPKTCFLSDIFQLPQTIKTYQPVCLNSTQNEINIHTHSITKLKNPYSTCTALEVYSEKNKRLIKAFKPYSTEYFLKDVLWNLALRFIIQIQFISTTKCLHMNINVTINNFRNDSQISKDIDTPKHDKPIVKCIEYNKRSIKNNYERKNQQSEKGVKLNNKNKKRIFYKLYRKCKSTTNIPSTEKCVNTPLNKIQNIEDFFQILSSQRGLSSVFDGHVAKKILSCIVEVKSWITDINPRQALLILLLTNKKDTPNLVRFRPILLQGIAVNRITRATELDMEIEVIERENLNKLPQYEGISYLPGSIENQDQLLEELYWIAKTTASDYQRPFDESSEILLKSLLEKRKKLNPSYLRVMARYVGLGLLKTPTRK